MRETLCEIVTRTPSAPAIYALSCATLVMFDPNFPDLRHMDATSSRETLLSGQADFAPVCLFAHHAEARFDANSGER